MTSEKPKHLTTLVRPVDFKITPMPLITTVVEVTPEQLAEIEKLPRCPHGRAVDEDGKVACPHCLGLNDLKPCPNCGSILVSRKCKLVCPQEGCGYYDSCSDFE